MTICPVLECIHNIQTTLKCKLDEIEVNDSRRCVNFQADNQWLQQQFRERLQARRRLKVTRS